MKTYRIQSDRRERACWLFAMLLALAVSAFGQTSQQPSSAPAAASEQKVRADYVIGPGDILEVKVADSPEISGKYRVGEKGDLALPLLPTSIKAAGLTAPELSKRIAEAIKAADILRKPAVNVFVDQYHSRPVMVLGAVAKPGVYPLERPTNMLEVLSLAGGLTPTAGTTLTVTRKGVPPTGEGSSANPAQAVGDTKLTIDLGKLVAGNDPSLNIEAQPGDVLNVSTAPVVYVVGAVVRPGGFALQDPRSGLTVLQALALAEGFRPAAAPGRTVIVRRSASGKDRQEIPVNLNKVMTGKVEDHVLQANDILFIPESGMKKGLRRMGDAALSAASTVVGYGFGLRVAQPAR